MRMALVLTLACALAAPAHAAEVAVDALSVIPIHGGVNTLARFAPDGRAATIVEGWRDNGNAHGHYAYMVLLPSGADTGMNGVPGLVPFDMAGTLQDTIGASPFDGERVLQTVRFARAKVDGKPATVAIYAALGDAPSGVAADHAPVEIRIYRLDHPGVGVGAAPDVFHLVKTVRPPGGFCNADRALTTVLRLPLPADYAGGKSANGCEE